ncbi:hypothetical protein I5H94_gp044 [Mycobacterium phage SwagPigglett]|uniref:Uncharacterized protein n=3 Tax=Cheoctovirus TaxID=1623281 RepID=A0A482JDB3_9CAUD|nr:hypothetical protein AU088_gp043 [Mycobacterium phage Cabrinians]YP_009959203.1 hypothetical protein I5H58_gp043 [Mycobacterium phage Lizziana]YP_009961660.1 hypothetical protein I5H82_gp042 [Mycobacterium phage Priscilla]YP_009962917.1 hypothetical protein I5H94_gp044 [Mycobacterium phage SwagPigglett]UVK58510.1 hypothetical protein SEA_JARCOB_43 [Mycobacterium phage Jarcob]ALM02303.1 hypothetical protein SEA_CABRINIANS_43 [Mycobacterium phage Cabrinians]AVI04297.1 hypothetical protein SE
MTAATDRYEAERDPDHSTIGDSLTGKPPGCPVVHGGEEWRTPQAYCVYTLQPPE